MNNTVLLVGECPNEASFRASTPFVGRSGEFLRAELSRAGIDPASPVVNAVQLVLHRKPHVKEILACRKQVLARVAEVNPGVIVCLGWTAARSVFGHVPLPAVHSRTAQGARLVVITHHPAYASRFRNVLDSDGCGTVAEHFRSDLLFAGYVAARPEVLARCLQVYGEGEEVYHFNAGGRS